MKFFAKFVFSLAVLYAIIFRAECNSNLFCQSELIECKCDYYTGTLSMDCSHMGIEDAPRFTEDKVSFVVLQ